MWETWFGTTLETIGFVALSTLALYLSVLVLVRLAGLRSFAEMASFDFAMTIAVGTTIGSTAISSSVALPQGIAALATLFLLQYIVGRLRCRTSWANALSDNEPRLVMAGSEIFEEALTEVRITRQDLYSKLREANVRNFDEVIAVVVENTGDISVIHTEGGEIDFDEELLTGVNCVGSPYAEEPAS